MKTLMVSLLVVTTLMSLAVTLSATIIDNKLPTDAEDPKEVSLRGTSSVFLNPRAVTSKSSSCHKNPKICRAKVYGAKTHCCHNKCVDVHTDRLNCGHCGVKCKHGEICCKGHVVRIMSDKKHCGRCDNRCKKGHSCSFGMCSYA